MYVVFALRYTVFVVPETVLRNTSPSGVIFIWQSPSIDKNVIVCKGAFIDEKLQVLL